MALEVSNPVLMSKLVPRLCLLYFWRRLEHAVMCMEAAHLRTLFLNLWAAGCKGWDAGWSCVFLPQRTAEMCPSRLTYLAPGMQAIWLPMAAWRVAESTLRLLFQLLKKVKM